TKQGGRPSRPPLCLSSYYFSDHTEHNTNHTASEYNCADTLHYCKCQSRTFQNLWTCRDHRYHITCSCRQNGKQNKCCQPSSRVVASDTITVRHLLSSKKPECRNDTVQENDSRNAKVERLCIIPVCGHPPDLAKRTSLNPEFLPQFQNNHSHHDKTSTFQRNGNSLSDCFSCCLSGFSCHTSCCFHRAGR